MATAYVIRKCDRTVTEAVTRGDLKHWHWQQFGFPVTDFAIIFALLLSVYKALGISPSAPIVMYDHDARRRWRGAGMYSGHSIDTVLTFMA